MGNNDTYFSGKSNSETKILNIPEIPLDELKKLSVKRKVLSPEIIAFIKQYSDIKPIQLVPYIKKYFDIDISERTISLHQNR